MLNQIYSSTNKTKTPTAAAKVELAACKPLGSKPRHTPLVKPLETRLQAILTPWEHSERTQAKQSTLACSSSTWQYGNKPQQAFAVEVQINCIAVSTRIQQSFARPATTTHSSL